MGGHLVDCLLVGGHLVGGHLVGGHLVGGHHRLMYRHVQCPPVILTGKVCFWTGKNLWLSTLTHCDNYRQYQLTAFFCTINLAIIINQRHITAL